MPEARQLAQLTLIALLAPSGALLSLNSSQARSAHATGRTSLRTLDTQATFTVFNADDSGGGSLRLALLNTNAVPGADTIVFDPTFFNTPRTITLTSGELRSTIP